MAKRNSSGQNRQAQHPESGKSSRHDKRKRLDNPNPKRKKTKKAQVPLTMPIKELVAMMTSTLDVRIALRLTIICAGFLLANGRKTVSSWLEAAGVKDDWDRFYDCLISTGKQAQRIAKEIVKIILQQVPLNDGEPIRLALDDSPTSRFGRHVEGAGVHHNPTQGTADGKWLYGHSWVTLAWLAKHPSWGTIALPVLSKLYVRQVDIEKLKEKYDWNFRTKLELGVEMLSWLVDLLGELGVKAPLRLAVDGAYAKANFLKPLADLGVTVFSRLRCDACLFDVPPPRKEGQLGRPRIYGENRLNLKKRVGQRRAWKTVTYNCRGVEVTRQCKTFLATTRLTGSVIRVVIVKFDNGWAAYFCTDPNLDMVTILEMIGDRWAIEEHFHDAKEVHGAGQQQVRNLWSNIGCWNLVAWMCVLIDLSHWNSSDAEIVDRSTRSWDNPDRRASHADRKRLLSRKMLHQHFLTAMVPIPITRKIKTLINNVIKLAT